MYILSGDYQETDPMDFEPMLKAFERYRQYLAQNRGLFPDSSYQFAQQLCGEEINDHQALRDSWVEQVSVVEKCSTSVRERYVDIEMKLLGPYHDGYILIRYAGVRHYNISRTACETGHGDFYRSEVRLSEKNDRVLHEIEWRGGDRWLIECCDISAVWEGKL